MPKQRRTGSSIRRSTSERRLTSMRSDEEKLDREVVEHWLRSEVVAAYDAMKADPSRAIPAEAVRAEFEAKWSVRERRPSDVR